MIRAIAQCLVILAFGAASAHAQVPRTPAAPVPAARTLDPARVEAFLTGAMRTALDSRRVAGGAVAVIDREGVVIARGFGEAGPGRNADSDTLFRVGSISKTPAWIALHQLAEDGRLKLDDPINDHLPPALQIAPEGFDEPILVRHLMTHSAGFEDSALGHLFVRDPAKLVALDAYLQRYRPRRVRPPGALSVYSNYGADLVGAIVAHEIGSDWQTYAEDRILRPLGMASATYREPYPADLAEARGLPAPMPEEIAARVSQGYRMEAGRLVPAPFEYVSQMASAGSMSASANDMAQYMRALLDPAVMAQAGVLHVEDARELSRPIFANDDRLGAWRNGFMTFNMSGGRWAYGHGGDTIFQHSMMIVSPDLGFGFFATVNTPSGAPVLISMMRAFEQEFFPIEDDRVRNDAAAAQSPSCAGTYRSLRRPYFRTERGLFDLVGSFNVAATPEGDLIIAAGGEARRFMPLGDGLYDAVDRPQRIAFREVDGRMMFLDTVGLAPAERIGFFEGGDWLALIGALGGLVAAWGVAAGARRLLLGASTVASLLFDGLCVLWQAAGVTFAAAALPWAGPAQEDIIFTYPGTLFPIACWLLAAAAIATLVVPLAAVFWARPAWGWLRWARAGAAVAVFAALSLTLLSHGLLGFSHF
jgi:CubicO group peptidase (beta-lactamase class C family)